LQRKEVSFSFTVLILDVVIPYLYNLERQKSVFSSKILSEKVPQNCSFCGSYKVAPQYRLATCKIEKSMSSISDAAICFLINTDAFIDNNKTISQEQISGLVLFSLCENVNVAESLDSAIREADPNGNSTLFTVIRNPFYRFISGYIDKCQKYCELHKNRNLYKVVKYQDGPDARQNFADAMEALLKSVGVPGNHRVVIYNEVMNGKMQHSTAGSSQRLAAEHELLSNDYLMWLLVKLYYNDFLLFYDID
uniref:Sulfotransfer_1 domain-containing protein n=1 Tax=Nippostrongylus brasiliensis TaxID=27835 RepID=A0A0N4YI93_NIPBR